MAFQTASVKTAHAEDPGGPALPTPDAVRETAHGDIRLGYYLFSDSYRYQAQYSLTYTAGAIAGITPYGLASVDVESVSNATYSFEPDRLRGTFEFGMRGGRSPRAISLFLRHQSPHNIDRADRRQGSWEMVGLRWSAPLKATRITVSGGYYAHRIAFDYQWDSQVDIERRLGVFLGRPWSMRIDLHGVSEGVVRSGFLDYWLEPSVRLGRAMDGFLGAGQVHDIDFFGGKTDRLAEIGVRVHW